jgi:hypothetical protein
MALGSPQPLTEIGTRNLPEGKGRPARKADNLTAICESINYKIWDPRRLIQLWASMACYRDSFAFCRVFVTVKHMQMILVQRFHKVLLCFVIMKVINWFVDRRRLVKRSLKLLSYFPFGFEVALLSHVRLHAFQLCPAEILVVISVNCWALWLRCLGHEPSSPPRTLRSMVRIPLEAWMSCAFILCLCSSAFK